MTKEDQYKQILHKISPRQKAFADAYLLCLNATQAAQNIGHAPNNASGIARKMLLRPEVREYLDFCLAESGLTELEVLKSVSDIARASVHNYFKPAKKLVSVQYKSYYKDQITALNERLEDLDLEPGLMDCLGVPLNEDELSYIEAEKRSVKKEIARLTLLVNRNPEGFSWAYENKEVETTELDTVKILNDQGARIKSYTVKENGEQRIEMHDALAAQQMLLRVYGSFEKDNRQQVGDTEIKVTIHKADESEDDEYLK